MPQNTINPTKLKDIFSNGNLVLATLSAHPLYITARNQYCYRMNCTFESGRRKMVQTKYYDTEAEAEAMYPVYKKQVEEKRITVFKCTVQEFHAYWTHSYCFDNTYNRSIAAYILPVLGKHFMDNVTASDLTDVLAKVPSSEFYRVCDAVTCFFRAARNHYCTTQDNSADAVRIMKERKKAEEDLHNYYEVPSGTYSPQQLLQMLQICKLEAPTIYLPMLLASTAGLRISEILTVTFRDIHFYNQTICLQLPVKDDLPSRTDTITIPEENKKMVYLADFVMDEIRLQRERLEACQKTAPDFNPSGYLIWGRNGFQRQNNFINQPYARICAKCPFPTFPWKELRRIKLSASSMKRFAETLGAENSGQPQPREIPKIPIDRSDLIELMK